MREIMVALRLFCMLHAPEAYVILCFKSLHKNVHVSTSKTRIMLLDSYMHTLNSCKIDVSVGVILLGAFFAGARDLSFDFYGYGVVFLANISTAVYLATIARTGTLVTRSLNKLFYYMSSCQSEISLTQV